MKHTQTLLLIIVLLLNICGLNGFSAKAISAPNLTPKQWVGQNFLFHALPADRQEEGYEIFKTADADRGWAGDRSVRLPYAGHVYKRVQVTAVVDFPAGTGLTEYLVYMTEKDTGMKLVGRTMRGQLDGVVLEDDLNQARHQFFGKKIYTKQRFLQIEDKLAAGGEPRIIPVKVGSEAQVVDVYAGIRTDEPIWLIVLADGNRAIVPIAYSWSNMRAADWKQTPPWQDKLFTSDPRPQSGWAQAVWDQIDAGMVDTGMTQEQVALSWGAPDDKMESPAGNEKVVWTYGSTRLTFSGDYLELIENGQ